MVSLVDSSSRIQHSIGRSMRTIRSNLFWNDVSPPVGHSSAISNNLTDSIVDFQLHELTARSPRPFDSKSATPSTDSAAELLELSWDFTDYCSFNSDISGELQWLASVGPIKTPPSPAASLTGDIEALPVEIASPSAEILEEASLESMEPVVRVYVEGLGSQSPEAKHAAAGSIRLLAKHRSDFRTLMIPPFVPLLKNADPVTQENTVTALLNLSLEDANKANITVAGAIKPLVYVLRTRTPVAKQNAACALLSLACEAIPPLVALLVGRTSRVKKDALTMRYKLCSVQMKTQVK